MTSDSAYFATAKRSLSALVQGAEGSWYEIPKGYLNYFHHEFADGDVSLLPAAFSFDNVDGVEDWQMGEVIDLLSKVDPREWPDCDSIACTDVEELIYSLDNGANQAEVMEYVEDNLGTSEKTQRVLKGVLESVFGKGVETIRSKQGKFPSPSNNFLQDKDGTFAGTFKFDSHLFDFEIAPTEKGWICTYRLDEKSLDNLEKPEFKGRRKDDKVKHRKVRSQGWR